ncbi:MAG: hypothetical protein ACOC83_08125 [Gemmatimonadota bacterium]
MSWRVRVGLTAGILVGTVGCGQFEVREPSLMSVTVYGSAEDFPDLELTVSDGLETRVFVFADLESAGPDQFRSDDFPVASDGTAAIDLELSLDGETVASGGLDIELQPEFDWGIGLFRQVGDPTDACFCCGTALQLMVAPGFERESGDSVWLTVGGAPKDAVC